MKISVIVIGKNEYPNIIKCLNSINDLQSKDYSNNYEIIYVDSDSKDESISYIKDDFKNVSIYKISGKINAAIARNVGVENSSGDLLFFLDGDMEVISDNIMEVFSQTDFSSNTYISGDFENYYYNLDGDLNTISKHYANSSTIYQVTTGGLFIISRNLWYLVNGMNPIFRRSQDLDFGLRLSLNGIKLKRFPIVIAKHHTIDYDDRNRFYRDMINGNLLYKGLLLRKHLLNRDIYQTYVVREVTLISLLFLTVVSFFTTYNIVFIYFLLIAMKSIVKKSYSKIIQYIFVDINTFLGFVFFYPSKSFNYSVQQCQ